MLFDRIELAIENYKNDCKKEKLDRGFKLQYLLTSGEACWLGPYIREKQLRDPFGQKIFYVSTPTSYELVSSGRDKMQNTTDDLKSSDSSSQVRKQVCTYKSNNSFELFTCIYSRQLLFVVFLSFLGIIFVFYKYIRKFTARKPNMS